MKPSPLPPLLSSIILRSSQLDGVTRAQLYTLSSPSREPVSPNPSSNPTPTFSSTYPNCYRHRRSPSLPSTWPLMRACVDSLPPPPMMQHHPPCIEGGASSRARVRAAFHAWHLASEERRARQELCADRLKGPRVRPHLLPPSLGGRGPALRVRARALRMWQDHCALRRRRAAEGLMEVVGWRLALMTRTGGLCFTRQLALRWARPLASRVVSSWREQARVGGAHLSELAASVQRRARVSPSDLSSHPNDRP